MDIEPVTSLLTITSVSICCASTSIFWRISSWSSSVPPHNPGHATSCTRPFNQDRYATLKRQTCQVGASAHSSILSKGSILDILTHYHLDFPFGFFERAIPGRVLSGLVARQDC